MHVPDGAVVVVVDVVDVVEVVDDVVVGGDVVVVLVVLVVVVVGDVVDVVAVLVVVGGDVVDVVVVLVVVGGDVVDVVDVVVGALVVVVVGAPFWPPRACGRSALGFRIRIASHVANGPDTWPHTRCVSMVGGGPCAATP